ncbi:HAD family hydrolase [Echinimonas agarilytica]|uniref:HAD-IA family hydrolase n=1 Tax=Echinimonas agarilytica TaxID=1215918 RepID=A0AA41W9D7_9GAMM|nr:HAD-IA family hydrolase [Echinimonas agarilytica]MCM2681151.1 HAD-IA family hydrolase [Echinimonas agarilytica]
MMNQSYELVIFDWDGTLMDSVDRIVQSLQLSAKWNGVQVPNADDCKSVIGMSLDTAVATLFSSDDKASYGDLCDGYRRAYLSDEVVDAPIFQGIEELLKLLQQQNIKLAVATGKGRQGLDRVLKQTGLGHFFCASAAGDEHPSKPNCAMIQHLMAITDVCSERTLMVGDSHLDLEMAINAGVDAVGVGCGVLTLEALNRLKPRYVVETTAQLCKVLTAPEGCNA